MKRKLNIIVLMLLILSCSKQVTYDDPVVDQWNGYRKFLKAGEQFHTLWAGKNINIGTVIYGVDENANFYVTYDCSQSGWLISETHMFAGDKAEMPLNKPGAPKIGQFPFAGNHNPMESIKTYYVPLSQLPPCASPGFVVAAHCVAHSPSGQTETAWAEGNYTFSDKGWGWYDSYFYSPQADPSPILYGTAIHSDTLMLYHIDILTGQTSLILTEYVGNTAGYYEGAAYVPESGVFLFTNYLNGELWVNQLQGDDPSFPAGSLSGITASGTYYDGSYYYVREVYNTIHQVTFTVNWEISGESVLDTIPFLMTVNDIAMSPDGEYLFIIGYDPVGTAMLVTWDVATHDFYNSEIPVNHGAQIAFSSDDLLYSVSSQSDDGGIIFIEIFGQEAELLELIASEIITVEFPFSDLAKGPLQ